MESVDVDFLIQNPLLLFQRFCKIWSFGLKHSTKQIGNWPINSHTMGTGKFWLQTNWLAQRHRLAFLGRPILWPHWLQGKEVYRPAKWHNVWWWCDVTRIILNLKRGQMKTPTEILTGHFVYWIIIFDVIHLIPNIISSYLHFDSTLTPYLSWSEVISRKFLHNFRIPDTLLLKCHKNIRHDWCGFVDRSLWNRLVENLPFGRCLPMSAPD